MDDNRHATWLELFFDLVFVAAIAELVYGLRDNLTWMGILGFVALLTFVCILQIGFDLRTREPPMATAVSD